jgi:hypothetical protein
VNVEIFLSYTEEDAEIATTIATRLSEAGHRVFNWTNPAQRGGRFRTQIEDGIRRARAFVALLSPRFLDAYWCNLELDLAINREIALKADDPRANFINVVDVGGVQVSDAGVLGSYDWLNMSGPGKVAEGLIQLVGRFDPGVQPSAGEHSAIRVSEYSRSFQSPLTVPNSNARYGVAFRNRVDELQKIINGLTNAAGPHFWIVVAPPQLGKTWFLERISRDDALSHTTPWEVRLVDLRAQPDYARSNVEALLTLLFGATSSVNAAQTPLRIAQRIGGSGRSHLCLLDGAELLDKETASTLRSILNQIYRLVPATGHQDLRLAFIVASRRDDEWKGVTPLRFAPLPLTEFNVDVVQWALHDLSVKMDRRFPPVEFRENAIRVHRVTEGLPALLMRCLRWIQDEQWLGMDRLETQEQFEKFADPYIQEELLTPATLLPDGQPVGQQMRALVEAYRVLSPYRLFTLSHLRHHLDSDASFRAALAAANWALTDLWEAISGTALLRRPLKEPWKEIQTAIRRLLFRHFYRSEEQRGEAHNEARKYVELWASKLAGMEQAVGLVECLWHEANTLRVREPIHMEQRLTESTRMLSRALPNSSSLTRSELREFAAERMKDDAEFEEVVGNGDGLLSRLVEMVLNPGDS